MVIDSDSGNSDYIYQFSTTEGLCLMREALLPYNLHNDQLKGICKLIDGINLMALMIYFPELSSSSGMCPSTH